MTEAQPREQYYTPEPCTRALLSHMGMEPSEVLEPCAGDGWISRVLEEKGHNTTTADVDPDAPVDMPGRDFFGTMYDVFQSPRCIITNPPWSDAALFVRRALELTPNVAMLLRLTFFEPCSDETKPKSYRPDLVKSHRSHLVLPRVSFYRGKSGTDSVCPAWFIWGFDWLDMEPWDVVTERQYQEFAGQQAFNGMEAV